jgi:4-nitrophenyl phosphatase
MIGDRLETDIAFGLKGNISTLLVLTGVSTREEAEAPHNPIRPHFITTSLSDIWTLSK